MDNRGSYGYSQEPGEASGNPRRNRSSAYRQDGYEAYDGDRIPFLDERPYSERSVFQEEGPAAQYSRNNPRYADRASRARQSSAPSTLAYSANPYDYGQSSSPTRSVSTQAAIRQRSPLATLLKVAIVLVVLVAAAFAAAKGAEAIGTMLSGVPADEEPLAATGDPASVPVADLGENVAEPAAPRTLTVTFAGDCTLGTDENFDQTRSFNAMYDEVDDPSYFLANVYNIFSNDDLTIVNMEGTLTTSTKRVPKKFAFKGPMEYAGILTAGDVEVASFTNNHCADYGPQSNTDTVDALEGEGILVAAEDKIAYTTVNGIKVAVIGVYELDDHREREDDVKEYISTARKEGAELVLVYFHWGNEREYSPDNNQIYMGHMAVDAGADMVVGSHPHVMQGYEVYDGRYIFYSLGNFCYGGHSNPEDKDCMVVQKTFTMDEDGVRLDNEVNVIPCSISSTSKRNNYQPTPATDEELERMEDKIGDLNDNVKKALASYKG